MQPTRTQVSAFTTAGPQVRTRNSDEMNPATARIGGLWGSYFSQRPPSPDARIYGIYSGYESDAHGAFDMTAAEPVDAASGLPTPDSVRVQVQGGDYLVFSGQGAMPQAVIDTWGQVWRYFAEHPQVQRCYGTDFEAYEGADKVAIHIGVKG
ncbi:GyrI-like domain-containing protein [Acidovorax sp.]|uniref:GyrI-like domain-containing protein n=1 Tax=Acidovorax sp. TaxID=1872122 RepID=UPI002619A398|nr:GyrI-like domain-containing protein [Acidovorax sp.]